MELTQKDKEFLLNSIREINDFPQPGIVFRDITTLLNNKEAFNFLMKYLKERYKSYNLDFIAGIESRGFIFGAALAHALDIRFVPIRKKGKLPYTTIPEKYSLEYGFSEIEIHIDTFSELDNPKVLLIDDLIATGGTAIAAANLIKQAKANLVESCFIINLKELQGSKELEKIAPIHCILNL
ncbi:adenine phosphoribosyltransferase [Helicobacter sp. WB40]|uniref:adenine phosphoribosyltransferase n=1 Tax=Helicobacter sp. WB40 TaxID=3004130 RepID=UPI0022EBB816|nr:adenine phosphoribosyltransferase [Helicobacter sp. WB40]MDA3967022.1 adenine phosphoribosyltransferase [Helicobacter sp. WB40]